MSQQPATRPVSAADFEALLALRLAAMRPSLEALGRYDEARARQRLAANFAAEHSRWILQDGEAIGWYAIRPAADHLSLDHLYLLPEHSGQGIGGRILQQLQAQARQLQLPIRLGALQGSAANLFYQRHGFVRTAEEEWDIYYQWTAPQETLP